MARLPEMVLFEMVGEPTDTYTPAPRMSAVKGEGPDSTVLVMMLLMIVGELKTKMPPPETLLGPLCGSPAPPVRVKPSSTVEAVWFDPNVTTLHWFPVRLAQKLLSVQGWLAALMVVAAAPPCDTRLTPGFIRTASKYVPGATLTVSPLTAAQM